MRRYNERSANGNGFYDDDTEESGSANGSLENNTGPAPVIRIVRAPLETSGVGPCPPNTCPNYFYTGYCEESRRRGDACRSGRHILPDPRPASTRGPSPVPAGMCPHYWARQSDVTVLTREDFRNLADVVCDCVDGDAVIPCTNGRKRVHVHPAHYLEDTNECPFNYNSNTPYIVSPLPCPAGLCYHFYVKKKCIFGNQCRFWHMRSYSNTVLCDGATNEKQHEDDSDGDEAPEDVPPAPPRVCRNYWQHNQCRFGSRCRYNHVTRTVGDFPVSGVWDAYRPILEGRVNAQSSRHRTTPAAAPVRPAAAPVPLEVMAGTDAETQQLLQQFMREDAAARVELNRGGINNPSAAATTSAARAHQTPPSVASSGTANRQTQQQPQRQNQPQPQPQRQNQPQPQQQTRAAPTQTTLDLEGFRGLLSNPAFLENVVRFGAAEREIFDQLVAILEGAEAEAEREAQRPVLTPCRLLQERYSLERFRASRRRDGQTSRHAHATSCVGPTVDEDDCETCSICLVDFADRDTTLVVETCQHRFHPPCISTWRRENASCPVCRHPIRPPQQ